MSFIPGSVFPSVTSQQPNPYWTFDDPYPQYIQVQRTLATITGTNINFRVQAFDPNTFLKYKAYIKLGVNIQKQERNTADGSVTPSNFDEADRIYKKPGMVLHNSCTEASLRLNTHTLVYKDLRYITKKLNTSFAGEKIINNYLSTSGGQIPKYNGVYNEYGDINNVVAQSDDIVSVPIESFGFDIVTPARISFAQATNVLTFVENGGDVIDLLATEIFHPGDTIVLDSGEVFIVIGTLSETTLLVERRDDEGDMLEQDLVAADIVNRLNQSGFQGDDGRQISYDEAQRDIVNGLATNTFHFTEDLSFGIFNHLANFEGETKGWSCKQSPLIPYIRQLELTMNFKDIAANSLIYAYGRNNDPDNTRECQLVDVNITTAELVLLWVKPRDELLRLVPPTVNIQSWQYDHKQFDLGLVDNSDTVESSENNIYTNQVPSYLLYYAMVDKDSSSYVCRALNSDSNGIGNDASNQITSVDVNSIETGMRPEAILDGADFILRSNTLGGDDIIDKRYNQKELYKLTLNNSVSDFPFSDVKFRGSLSLESSLSTYPSEYYILLGEQQLNSFFIRKGQLQVSNVMDFNSTQLAVDGYSVSQFIDNGAFDGGDKIYALHIFYIYDRFHLSLSADGHVDSRFDSVFL